MGIKILKGDCLETLKSLDEQSINTCVTSPPYWGLRDYGTGEWVGGDPDCPHMRTTKISKDTATGHKAMYEQGNVVGDAIYKSKCPKCGSVRKDKQLGLEETPEEFVENLVRVFKEVKRVLRDDGTVWLNLGDSYYNYRPGKGQALSKQSVSNTDQDLPQDCARRGNKIAGLKEKDLVGIPWRVAFALQADGWYLRQDIIWHKPNPMPESVRDRCTKSHEYIFLLSKNPKYYYDNEAIKEDSIYHGKDKRSDKGNIRYEGKRTNNKDTKAQQSFVTINEKKNKRSVWTITTKPYKAAHFATFPTELIEPCVLAGCPEKVCVQCSEPYKRMTSRNSDPLEVDDSTLDRYGNGKAGVHRKVGGQYQKWLNENPLITVGWEKQCDCQTNETKGGTVLDPFGGSGTTGLVASKHNRNAVLCELNEGYIDIAEKRLNDGFDMFSSNGLEII
jgi:DNA modification methylase